MSQPARAVWIEILQRTISLKLLMSQPARAVWIEISRFFGIALVNTVTACEGCVD